MKSKSLPDFASLLLCAFVLLPGVNAQDVVIIGLNSDGDDQVAFVAAETISGSAQVYFTDAPYDDTNNSFTNTEGVLQWTAPAGGISKDDVVLIQNNASDDSFTLTCSAGSGATCGTVSEVNAGFTLAVSGDQVYAYTATDSGNPFTTVTEIFGVVDTATGSLDANANPTSDYPKALVVDLTTHQDNAHFTGSRTNTTQADIENLTNWTTSNDAVTISTTAFTNSSLPVELVLFRALASQSQLILHWTTASETNNAGFEVQQKVGTSFTSLGFVEGFGTTLEAQTYEFEVPTSTPGPYTFRLKQVDFDGHFEYSAELEVTIGLPDSYRLSEAYPNPFNATTSFTLSVQARQEVTVAVYDLMGRLVRTLYAGVLEANQAQAFTFEASDLPSGVYIIQAQGETFTASQRVMLVK